MYAREESYGASSGPKPCWGIKLSSNSSFTGLKSLSPSPESCPSTTNLVFLSLRELLASLSMQALSFSLTRGSLLLEKNSLSADREILRLVPFLQASEGTYVCVSGYIIFSEEVPRTRYYPPSALLDNLGWLRKWVTTFLPNSSTSLRDLSHISRYLESVLHSPQQQCLVLTNLSRFRGETFHFKRFSRRLPEKN